MAQRTRWLQGLDHLLERNVLMFVGRQERLADLFQQLPDARVLPQVDTQGQGVDDRTDQALSSAMNRVTLFSWQKRSRRW